MARKKQGMSNNSLAALVLLAIVVSVAGTWVALTRGPSWLSLVGAASSSDTGTAQLELSEKASLRFAISGVNWGAGWVNTTGGSNTQCILDTNGNSTGCVNFTTNTAGLVLENDGNVNLTVEIKSDKTASTFIGGTSPVFQWAFMNNETDSCSNLTGSSSYVNVITTYYGVCNTTSGAPDFGGLGYLNDKDTIRVNLNVSIPYDAPQAAKTATITALGSTF